MARHAPTAPTLDVDDALVIAINELELVLDGKASRHRKADAKLALATLQALRAQRGMLGNPISPDRDRLVQVCDTVIFG